MNFFCSNLAAMLLKARACSLSVQTWFFSVVFFGISSTLIDAHTLPGQTEGLKGGFKEWVGGLQKLITVLDMRNGHTIAGRYL
jgi:hypothetical protein